MFKFLKSNKVQAPEVQQDSSLFGRLRSGLSRTRSNLAEGLQQLVLGKKVIDQELLEDIEVHLLTADVGIEATQKIIQTLTEQVSRKHLSDPNILFASLQQQLVDLLGPCTHPLDIPTEHQPMVVLVVGVNGSGKTTTIGKLAKHFQQQGKKVMLAAGDTFRAAAIEQLQVWGERSKIPVVAQRMGSDSASVLFDAMQSAKAKGIDVLIADTAGRLHTQDHLMDELKKIKRVIQKVDTTAPHEVLLVLDAGIGQNAIRQMQAFNAAVGVTGLALTKLDGTAKGGVIFALARQQCPIRFIGVGEGIDDLQPFDAEAFTQALFD